MYSTFLAHSKKILWSLISPFIRFTTSLNPTNIDSDGQLYFYHAQAYLRSYRPAVLSNSSKWISEFVEPLKLDFPKLSGVREWFFILSKPRIDETIKYGILITFLYPENYFHWWVDMLARLGIVKSKVNLNQYTFIVNTPLNSWQEQSLELILGFKPDLFVRGIKNVEVKHLLTISSIRTKERFSKIGLEVFRKNLLRFKSGNSVGPKKIFISRKREAGRNITNENECEAVFDKFGIKKVFFEDLPLLDQIKMINEADLVIAVHGAALTNILFASPNLKVIEIMGAINNPLYKDLAEGLSIPYIQLKGTPVDKRVKNSNVSINLEQLMAALS